MAERSFPFDSNPDTSPQEVYEEDFSRMLLHAVGDGTTPDSLVASIVGTNISIGPGFGLCRGYGYVNDGPLSIPIPLNPHPTLFRGDRIFLRLTKDTNQVRLHHVQGVPTASLVDPAHPFPGNQPTGPTPTQTANTWDVYMYYIVVPPNNSAALQLYDERSFSIVSPTGFRSGMHADAYVGSYSQGQLSFVRGINYWPHWRAAVNGTIAELYAEGPRRLIQKSSDTNYAMDGDYRNITGWNTLEQNRQTHGLHLTLEGGGLKPTYSGFYRFDVTVSCYGGGGGRRTIRLQNRTRNTTLAVASSHPNYISQTLSITLNMKRWVQAGDIVALQIAGLGGGSATVSTFGTYWHTEYVSSGRIIDDA
jgi:hypothetical protein